jgi:hypothetical protein
LSRNDRVYQILVYLASVKYCQFLSCTIACGVFCLFAMHIGVN